jgi:hypothetical protein
MPPSNSRSNRSFQDTVSSMKPSVAFVVMIFGALIAFEIFNYSTTEHALGDLLGNLAFAGIPWATVLAMAFCGIDFAGIARLFTPEQGMDEPKEVWYLFGAWLLAATMNAILTWWGVAMAVASHPVQSAVIVDQQAITTIVPVFVAVMVWVIRILIIGTLSLAMDRLMHPGVEQRTAFQNALSASARQPRQPIQTTQPMNNIPAGLNSAGISSRPSASRSMSASRNSRPSPAVQEEEEYTENSGYSRGEPTYHSMGVSARPPVKSSAPNENSASSRYRRS